MYRPYQHTSFQHRVCSRRRQVSQVVEPKNTLPPMYEYLDKQVHVQLKNGGGHVSGTLIGFDILQNICLANAVDQGQKRVSVSGLLGEIFIRGNTVHSIELLK
ncbi:hypothetical protein FRC18_000482 [Serendipita sp. 400]|nr:hypothetical protein FRC18_000482 [Serendipita sp. 400]